MNKYQQENIISALKEKGATQPCPRCRNLEFEVIGETKIPLDMMPDSPSLDQWINRFKMFQSSVPIVLVSCTNCGYIAQHAKRLLDLTS